MRDEAPRGTRYGEIASPPTARGRPCGRRPLLDQLFANLHCLQHAVRERSILASGCNVGNTIKIKPRWCHLRSAAVRQ